MSRQHLHSLRKYKVSKINREHEWCPLNVWHPTQHLGLKYWHTKKIIPLATVDIVNAKDELYVKYDASSTRRRLLFVVVSEDYSGNKRFKRVHTLEDAMQAQASWWGCGWAPLCWRQWWCMDMHEAAGPVLLVGVWVSTIVLKTVVVHEHAWSYIAGPKLYWQLGSKWECYN